MKAATTATPLRSKRASGAAPSTWLAPRGECRRRSDRAGLGGVSSSRALRRCSPSLRGRHLLGEHKLCKTPANQCTLTLLPFDLIVRRTSLERFCSMRYSLTRRRPPSWRSALTCSSPNHAKHLQRLLTRLEHVATVSGVAAGNEGPLRDFGIFLEAKFRTPIVGRWPALAAFLRFFGRRSDEPAASSLDRDITSGRMPRTNGFPIENAQVPAELVAFPERMQLMPDKFAKRVLAGALGGTPIPRPPVRKRHSRRALPTAAPSAAGLQAFVDSGLHFSEGAIRRAAAAARPGPLARAAIIRPAPRACTLPPMSRANQGAPAMLHSRPRAI